MRSSGLLNKVLPSFLVIGSQKAGTTSLYNVLRAHPEVFMSRIKEINFFSSDDQYRKKIDHYHHYFAAAPGGKKAIGEASPGYICHPEAPQRIRQAIPDAKLICVVRNPIDRAYSQFWDNRRRLAESMSFAERIRRDLSPVYVPGQVGYFSRGCYMTYIRRYLGLFSPGQLLVLLFDDLIADPNLFYMRCFEFLGVDDSFRCSEMEERFNRPQICVNPLYRLFYARPALCRFLPARLRRVVSWGPRREAPRVPMDEVSRETLKSFYAESIRELAEFLGRDLGHWA